MTQRAAGKAWHPQLQASPAAQILGWAQARQVWVSQTSCREGRRLAEAAVACSSGLNACCLAGISGI